MQIIFVDKNESLVKKVKKAIKFFPEKITVKCGDIFEESGVIVSASNPKFTMGGGLDALIAQKYPKECGDIDRKDGNQRHGNVIFTITVGEDLMATRELVTEALRAAFDNTEKNETVLISGLGTGIGGLDEDDFVWIFLKVLSEYYGYGWGIKFTKENGSDFRTGKVLYIPGEWIEQEGAKKDGEECGVGLHLGKDFVGSGNYNTPDKIFFCIYKKEDLCGDGDDKVRVSKLLTVAELPKWLGYGRNGKKILDKIGKKFDPKTYNPYQAEKIPTIKEIQEKMKESLKMVGDQVRSQVWDQIGKHVGDQVMEQVRSQVWLQVWDQVRGHVGSQVGSQVWSQVGSQFWSQVGSQFGATSYWAVNIHFELGISHWFGDFISLGIMPIFVDGKMKVFGKKGKYLGEYDMKDFNK